MTKKKNKVVPKAWKPVEAEDLFVEGTNFDGLLGIEELVDYDIESFKKPHHEQRSPSPEAASDYEEEEVPKKRPLEEIEEVAAPIKKKKKSSKKSPAAKTGWSVSCVKDNSELDMSAWKNLFVPEPVLRALQEQGFSEPTKIQTLALPSAIMGRKDVLGAAETGSGKTLAFGIPIVHRILDYRDRLAKGQIAEEELNELEEESESEDEETEDSGEIGCVKVEKSKYEGPTALKMGRLHALILTPTRELAIQVKNHLVAATKYCDIRIATVVGGMAQEKQERVLKKCPEIVVATPGRLWELVKEGNPFLQQVDKLPCLVIDEADRMMERGHFQELRDLLERMDLTKARRQTLVFSATLSLVHDAPKRLAYKKQQKGKKQKSNLKQTPGQKLNELIELLGMKNPKIVDITAREGTAETLTEAYVPCRLEEKDAMLYAFLRCHPGRTLVFLNSVSSVRRLANVFGLLQCTPVALHAQMQQKQRLRSLERFAANPSGLLLATDVAARGLDIVGVQHVIHYHVPRTAENYVHRSGRTARAQKEGMTVLFVEAKEMPLFKKMCHTLGKNEDMSLFPVDRPLFDEVRKRIEMAKELEQLEHSHKRTQSEEGWLNKAAKELDLHFDEYDDLPIKRSVEPGANRALNAKRKSLEALLKKPLMVGGVSGKFPTSSNGLVVPYALVTQRGAVELMKSKNVSVKNLGQELGFAKRKRPKFSSKKKKEKK